MLNQIDSSLFLHRHTFGRDHLQPPALKTQIQMESSAQVLQQMGMTEEVLSMQAISLPEDFDQIVRSVGEW